MSSKIGVIESLLSKCDKLVIGGGMVFTFLKARGLNVGRCTPPLLAAIYLMLQPIKFISFNSALEPILIIQFINTSRRWR